MPTKNEVCIARARDSILRLRIFFGENLGDVSSDPCQNPLNWYASVLDDYFSLVGNQIIW